MASQEAAHAPASEKQEIVKAEPIRDQGEASDDEDLENQQSLGGVNATESAPLTPEGVEAVRKQVEFYFSDASLPSDKKLLKQIRKDPEGYVPIKVFANFRKVRALTRDISAIAAALSDSTILQLHPDGKHVKRIVPVPEYNIEEIQKRTVVVEGLPVGSTIESVTKLMSKYGNVKLVRICSKDTKGKLPAWLTTSIGAVGLHSQHSLGGRSSMGGPASGDGSQQPEKLPHAYVEFKHEDEAVIAVAALHDTEGWRIDGIQVNHLVYEASDTPRAPVGREHSKLMSRNSTFASANSAANLGRRGSYRDDSSRGGSRGGSGNLNSAPSERQNTWSSNNDTWRSSAAGSSAGGTGRWDGASQPSTPVRASAPSVSRFASGAGGGNLFSSGGGGGNGEVSTPNTGKYVPPSRRSISMDQHSANVSGDASPTSPTRASASNWATPLSPAAKAFVPRSSPGDLLAGTTTGSAGGGAGGSDAFITAASLGLKPIRTGAAGAARPPAPAAAASDVRVMQSNSAGGGEQPAAAGGATSGPQTPSRPSPVSRLNPTPATTATGTPVRSSPGGAATGTPGRAKAPKFVLDLNNDKDSKRGGIPVSRTNSAMANSFTGGARPVHPQVQAAATNSIAFQPLSPSCMPATALAHMPFHHNHHEGQYVEQLTDFIDQIITGSNPPPTAATAAVTTRASDATNTAGAPTRDMAEVLAHVDRALSRVSESVSSASGRSAGGGSSAGGGVGPRRIKPATAESSGGGGVDEELTRFKAALEDASNVNPASAQAQAYASRALAAAEAIGGRVSARPPRPHGAPAALAAQALQGLLEGRDSAGRDKGLIMTRSSGQVSGLSFEGNTPTAYSKGGEHEFAHDEEGSDGEGGEVEGDGTRRRRRRRGSRAGVRSRRNSSANASAAGASSEAATPPSHTLGGAPDTHLLPLPSSIGGGNGHPADALAGEQRSSNQRTSAASRLASSSGGGAARGMLSTSLKAQESVGAAGGVQAPDAKNGARRPSKVDYASWAAATPEYRAEATRAKALHSGASDAAGAPTRIGTAPDTVGPALSSGPHVAPTHIVAQGPDGTKGFNLAGRGRGRPMQPPV